MASPEDEYDATGAYLDESVQAQWTGEVIMDCVLAEIAAQEQACNVTLPRTADLMEALCRRVARNLALRAIPLGMQMGQQVTARVSSNDPEVKRLEGPYRKWAIR